MIHALFPTACYARPVIPLTIAFMAGIVLGSRGACGWWSAAALAVCLAAGAALLQRLTRGRAARFSPLMLLVALGVLSIQPWTSPRLPENHVGRFIDTGPWEITGTVDARPLEFESRTRFALRVEHLGDGGELQAVSGLLRVTLLGPSPELAQGDRIVFKSRIRPIRNFENPGGFDYRRFMSYQGVWAAAVAEAREVVVLDRTAKGGLLGAVDRLRGRVARQIDAAGLGPAEAAVLKALVIGERSGVSPEVRTAFTRSGVSHLLAISGLHIGIVATAAFVAFRWLLGLFPRLLMAGGARKGAALLTLAPVCLYALLAGMSPSTQRALVMAVVFLLAFLFEREHDLMNTLALAALAILAVHPPALFSISFQLSFAAVVAIVAGMPAARRRAGGTLRPLAPTLAERITRAAGLFVMVSVLATAGTLPLVLHYFNTVSLIGVPANLVAVPVIGYGVVLVGLAGAVTGLVWAAAAEVLFKLGGGVLANAVAAIQWMADMPFAALTTVTPSWVEIVLFYLALGCSLHLVRGRRPSMPAALPARDAGVVPGVPAADRRSQPGRLRCAHPAAAALALCLLAGAADAGYWLYQRFWHPDLRMTLIDVGQGSAALLELPGGRTVLVDGGGFSDNSDFDVGAAVVAPYLWRRKIATVDRMILSHPNSDHLNGLVFIANRFKVGSLWTNGEAWYSNAHRALMRAVAERGITMPRFEELPHASVMNGVGLEVFYPPPDFGVRRETERWRRDPNNNSLVTRFSFGEVSILLPGDIMRPAEKELVAQAGGRLRSSVLVAPHHGSRSSSSEEFLEAVQPRVVFISCAGRPGLPHPQVLERYESSGSTVYRTDKNGAIRLVTDGRRLAIEPFIAQ
jgi:competence protein ComEC